MVLSCLSYVCLGCTGVGELETAKTHVPACGARETWTVATAMYLAAICPVLHVIGNYDRQGPGRRVAMAAIELSSRTAEQTRGAARGADQRSRAEHHRVRTCVARPSLRYLYFPRIPVINMAPGSRLKYCRVWDFGTPLACSTASGRSGPSFAMRWSHINWILSGIKMCTVSDRWSRFITRGLEPEPRTD